MIDANKITFIRESGTAGGDAPGWVLEMDARFAPAPKGVVFDLVQQMGRAMTENCEDWRTSSVQRGGRLLRAIFSTLTAGTMRMRATRFPYPHRRKAGNWL